MAGRTLQDLKEMLENERSFGVLDNVVTELREQNRIGAFNHVVARVSQHKSGRYPIDDSELSGLIADTLEIIELAIQRGSSRACPEGKIRRKAYTRKDKTKVPSGCIKDRGAVGRWQTLKRMIGIGPLKKGHLKGVGYDPVAPASSRHAALDKAVSRYGRNSTIRKLNAIATYTKRTVPSRAKTYRKDMHYIQKKFL